MRGIIDIYKQELLDLATERRRGEWWRRNGNGGHITVDGRLEERRKGVK